MYELNAMTNSVRLLDCYTADGRHPNGASSSDASALLITPIECQTKSMDLVPSTCLSRSCQALHLSQSSFHTVHVRAELLPFV